MKTGARENAGTPAFTLLELILVMFLVSAVAATAWPALGLFRASRAMSWNAQAIISLAESGRSGAVSEGRPWRLEFDTGEGSCRLIVLENDLFSEPATPRARPITLPAGTTIEFIAAPAAGAARSSVPGLIMPWEMPAPENRGRQNGESITFFPDGRATPAALRLSDERGNVVEIVLASPSEPLRIAAIPEEWQ